MWITGISQATIEHGAWVFLCPPRNAGGCTMDDKELAYARHSALTLKNWDTFQAVARRCLRHLLCPSSAKRVLPRLKTAK